MEIHIIYTEGEMLLSRKPYSCWREIQEEYADYQTSLGPWGEVEVIGYLREQYPDLEPPAAQQVRSFAASGNVVQALSWQTRLLP